MEETETGERGTETSKGRVKEKPGEAEREGRGEEENTKILQAESHSIETLPTEG